MHNERRITLDALMMNKYFNPKMLLPYFADKNVCYTTVNWATGKLDEEKDSLHRILQIVVTHSQTDELIAEFSFIRCCSHNCHFVLTTVRYDRQYYDEHQERYFDLFLPLSTDFVSYLKKQYYDLLNIK